MNNITRPCAMVSVMRLRRSSVTVQLLSASSLALILFRRLGGQRERVNGRARADHDVVERGVDQTVAFDRPLAGERRRDDGRVEMVAAPGRVDDADVGVGKRRPDTRADVVGSHVRSVSAAYI